ncbi:fluoroquinolone export ABC transporter permease subunit [Salinactinospora qingdaonensis]|uniref:Multidrug ABC transporter permease n=1 Tax=Salinactinospora qingdaonensis TaxID=702744 RepID=A0ABP7GCL0_9ACTN
MSALRGLRSSARLELRLQKRYGFGYAALFSAVLWLAILLPIPADYRDVAAPLVLFGDLIVVAFFFIAGSVFFEKGERTLFALVVTPLRFRDYLLAKLLSLTLLSVVLSLIIIVGAHGLDFAAVPMLTGVVVTTVLMLLVSFVTAVPYPSITDWILPVSFLLAVLSLPLLHYSGLWQHWLLYLIPTQGALILFGAAFDQLTPTAWEVGYAVGYQLLWIAALALLAKRAFDRYIVAGEGQ